MDEKTLETIKQLRRETVKAQFPDSEIAMAARRPGVTGLGMKFEYPDGTVRDKWGNIIKDEKE